MSGSTSSPTIVGLKTRFSKLIPIHIIIYSLLLSSVLARSPEVALPIAYSLASISYTALIIYIYSNRSFFLKGTKVAVFSLLIIFGTHILNILFLLASGNDPFSPSIRLSTYIIFTSINLFIIPYQIEVGSFIKILSRLSALIALISIPTAIINSYTIAGFTIHAYEWGFNLPTPLFSPDSIHPIQGPFNQPNLLGFLTSVAFIASLGEFRENLSNRILIIPIGLNFIGAYLSGSRAAFYFSICGGILFILFTLSGIFSKRVISMSVFISSMGFTALYSGIVPQVNMASFLSLQGREVLWPAAVEAIKTKPITGFGPGDQIEHLKSFISSEELRSTHNSYLRMYLTTGIIGGTAYVVFTHHVIISSISNPHTRYSDTITTMILVIVLHQVFAGFAIFASVGISLYAIISAISFGYGIRQVMRGDIQTLATE